MLPNIKLIIDRLHHRSWLGRIHPPTQTDRFRSTIQSMLDRLPQPVIYIVDATILYLDALSARDIRPTDDVDCVVEVTSQREYDRLSAFSLINLT
jgi:hypothetical protein